MRIIHWGKYYPPHMGGIESVTSSLARGAAKAGHDVRVVCFDARPDVGDDHDGPVLVRRAPIEWFKASQPLGRRYLKLLLQESRQADVVHLHAPNMLAALASMFLPSRIKLLVHWHSDVIGKGYLHAMTRPIESAMLRRAQVVVCTSPPYADSSAALAGWRKKVRIIPLGAVQPNTDVSANTALPPALEAFVQGRSVVLAVGRLVPYKGFGVLVDAARSFDESTAVVIVGSGPLENALRDQILRLGLADRVCLAGRLERDVLDALMRRATLFSLPSVERAEAFGVAMIEAMSYGLPVVATRIVGSGVPWVNEDGVSGLNVEPGDAGELGEACRSLLEDAPRLARMGKAALSRFENLFHERVSVERTLALYGELMGS